LHLTARLALLGIWAAALAVGCAVVEAPAPEPAGPRTVVTVKGGLDADLRGRLEAAVMRLGFDPAPDGEAGAGVTVVHVRTERAPGVETMVRYWAVFTGFWSALESVDLAAHGGPGSPPLYAPEELRHGAMQVVGGPAAAEQVRWLPVDEIAARLEVEPASVALLPLDMALPRLRSLAVEGVDPVRGTGDLASSRLVERLYIGATDGAGEAAAALAQALAVPAPSLVRIVATGDIIPARCVYARQRARNDYAAAFRPTAEYLRSAEITAGSLDAAISDAGQPIGCEQTFNLLAPARSVEGLAHAGFDVITVATNHAKDCGSAGIGCGNRSFLETLANLRAAGIEPVGGGEDYAAAHRPVVITRHGVRFGFLAYDDVAGLWLGAGPSTPGTAAPGEGAVSRDVTAARAVADVVVVMMQWGVEYESVPTQRQRDLAREAVDAGAALVIGNHPHVVQGVEWRAGAFVAYALGNFVFDQDWSLETQQGAVLEASFLDGRLAGVRLLPVRIVDMFQPTWAPAAEARAILERMRAASRSIAQP
jgi:poly-gamma-glutamate synthesis protein (capsule biosynthesis protein)